MKIACLGWGSLIWKPAALPLRGDWQKDGPLFPIELCRVADGGELSTAICPDAAPLPVLWAWLAVDNLEQACAALADREQIPAARTDGVGRLRVSGTHGGPLHQWATARQIDAVVWTALPPRYADTEGRLPALSEAVDYLAGLNGDTRAHALSYVRQLAAQIDTPYRRAISHSLGLD